MTDQPELKPCPWCNKLPEEHVWYDKVGGTSQNPKLIIRKIPYQFICENDDCLIQPATYSYKTRKEAIETWNTRSIEDALQAKIDEQAKRIYNLECILGNIVMRIEAGKAVTDGYLEGIAMIAKKVLGE